MSTGGALFELEDQQWFPGSLRRMQVEYIGWLVMAFHVYGPLAAILAKALKNAGTHGVVDLASGNGGPILDLARCRGLEQVEFTLTDRFPSPGPTGNFHVEWLDHPLDALAMDGPKGFRTMFNAYHHFSEAEKRALVRDHGRQGLLVAELLRPDVLCLLQILLVTTIGQVLLCPFVRPFRWERLLFTWIIPVNVITVVWDGSVSVLRVDSQRRIEARAREFAPPGSIVESGVCGPWWARVTWFTVIPERL